MNTIHVVNIKCGGCEKKITESLENIGVANVKIDVVNQTVSFDGDDVNAATKKLAKMGYPEANSPAAKKLSKKAKSYVSCAVGRWG